MKILNNKKTSEIKETIDAFNFTGKTLLYQTDINTKLQ